MEVDAAGRQEPRLRNDRRDCLKKCRAADERCREDLDRVAAERQRAPDLGHGGGAGHEVEGTLLCRLEHIRVEAGRDTEARAGFDRLEELLLRPDGAGTHEEAFELGRSADRIRRRSCTKGHLDHRDPAGEQGAACAHRLIRVVGRQHGHDAERTDPLDDLAHRASQPPSTGTTAPLT